MLFNSSSIYCYYEIKCFITKCLYNNLYLLSSDFMQCSVVAGVVVWLVNNILVVESVLVSVGMVLWMLKSGAMVVVVVVSVDSWMVLEGVAAGSNCNCSLLLVLKRLGMCCIWAVMVMVLECVVGEICCRMVKVLWRFDFCCCLRLMVLECVVYSLIASLMLVVWDCG